MSTPRQIEMADCIVTARDNGEEVSARVFLCPECQETFGPPLFTVFQIGGHDHVHLQCGYCTEAYCGGTECAPAEKKIIVVPR